MRKERFLRFSMKSLFELGVDFAIPAMPVTNLPIHLRRKPVSGPANGIGVPVQYCNTIDRPRRSLRPDVIV